MNLQTILSKIVKADYDYNLINDGDVIGVGVSGGKDSMVLLVALHMYSLFKQKNFTVKGIHIEMGFPNMDFSDISQYLNSNNIEYHSIPSQIYKILQLHPNDDKTLKCSLCSKFKKGAVINAAKDLSCNKIAFAHHCDDAVETLLMNTIYGGKLATFVPKMYMSRSNTTFIRPLIYAYESDIINAINNNAIPIVKSTCPNDGFTQRQAMKNMLNDLYDKYPSAKYNFLNMLSNTDQIELWEKEK